MAKKRGSNAPNTDSVEDSLPPWAASLLAWSRQNTQTVVILVVVLVLGAGAGVYYYGYRSDVVAQASDEFERIQQTVVGVGDSETAVTELQTFLERFGDTPLAPEARMLLGEAHLHMDQPTQAVTVLQPMTSDLGESIAVQAAFLQAVAHEQADQPQEAVDLYLRIADEAEFPFQVRKALSDAARIRMATGNPSGAAELYRQALETFEGDESAATTSENRTLYELRLAEAEAAARDS